MEMILGDECQWFGTECAILFACSLPSCFATFSIFETLIMEMQVVKEDWQCLQNNEKDVRSVTRDAEFHVKTLKVMAMIQ